MSEIGRIILVIGVILVVLGLILTAADRIPVLRKLGHLPGDIHIKSKSGNFQVYIPLTTCILLSLILTLIFRLFRR
ncbi:MAG: DUF2905 domain-containing protein [Bacillota bacterium]|jgi:uncharacterized membrane protein|nr:DUF2905 domain-containing protein [Bacillota bacterium]HOB91739.1 DUF2905 domain-containing protein [Bacillota bacterium]HPZ54608.1 DUF2905 domain-containing protein [Bacillota bacterium]HQD18984.1 DUF2905 domain-containing protein [Bacillota bacterium]